MNNFKHENNKVTLKFSITIFKLWYLLDAHTHNLVHLTQSKITEV